MVLMVTINTLIEVESDYYAMYRSLKVRIFGAIPVFVESMYYSIGMIPSCVTRFIEVGIRTTNKEFSFFHVERCP